MPILHPAQVKPRYPGRLWLRYDDGVEGEIDLGPMIARGGIFGRLQDPDYFERVRIGPHGQVHWDDQMELCSDALYMQLTGKNADEVFPRDAETLIDA